MILVLVVLGLFNSNRIMYSPPILAGNIFPTFLVITAVFSFIMWMVVMKRNAKEKGKKRKIENVEKGKVEKGNIKRPIRKRKKKG